MMKKILIGLFLLIALFSTGYYFFNQYRNNKPEVHPLEFLPEETAVLFSSNRFFEFWYNLSKNSLIYQELLQIEKVESFNRFLTAVDSIAKQKPHLKFLISDNRYFLAFIPNQIAQNEWVFTTGLYQSEIGQIIQETSSFLKQVEKIDLPKDSLLYYRARFIGTEIFFTEIGGNLVVASHEDVLKKIQKTGFKQSLKNSKGFMSMFETLGNEESGSVMLQLDRLAYTAKPVLTGNLHERIKNFGKWSALDIKQNPDAFWLTGLTDKSDSLLHFLSVIDRQQPQNGEIIRIVPEDVSGFYYLGFSNFPLFNERLQIHLKHHYPQLSGEQALIDFSRKYGRDPKNDLVSWINNELILWKTPAPERKGFCAAFSTTNIQEAYKSVYQLQLTVLNNQTEKMNITKYKDVEIFQSLFDSSLFIQSFGQVFGIIHQPYVLKHGKYLVFANRYEDAVSFIDKVSAEKTLTNNELYKDFTKNISDDVNLMIYSGIRNIFPFFKSYLSSSVLTDFMQYENNFTRFRAMSLQFSNTDKYFFTNFYIHYSPEQKTEPGSLWELQLDTQAVSKPVIVQNHNDSSREILIQDIAGKLYLISNTGRILWKKNIGNQILGKISQVDALKNNKLQYFFATAEHLHLVDRLGNDVAPFPVKVGKLSADAALMDYDNDKYYRILCPLESGEVMNYDISGKKITGFSYKADEKIVYPFQHTVAEQKDFIVSISASGKPVIINRKGEIRLRLKEKLKYSLNNNFTLESAEKINQIKITSIDSLGKINELNFADELTFMFFEKVEPGFQYLKKELSTQKQKHHVLLTGKNLFVYDQNKQKLAETELPESGPYEMQHFVFPGGKGYIGVLDRNAQKIFLYNHELNLTEGFPLKGNSFFEINDINQDKNFDVIVSGFGKNIYTYTLR